jgi:D-galactarolactone cycloisomerase
MTTITEIEAYVLRSPHGDTNRERYRSSTVVRSVYPASSETMLVRIVSGDHEGWGEALTPAVPEAPHAVIRHLFAPLLVGREFSGVRPITRMLQETMRERGHMGGHHADAVAAVDMALWDLEGQLHGLPIHRLLGGAVRDRVPVYLTSLAGRDAEERADRAREARAAGFRDFKIHLMSEPASALATFDVVADALAERAGADGPARLALDAHWIHDRSTARRLAVGLAEREAWFLEAPLAPEDLEGHAELARSTGVAIAGGEALRHRFEFAAWIAHQAIAIGQPDLGRVGISEATTIATLLEAGHAGLAPHHSMASPIAYAAALHVSAVAENLLSLEYPTLLADRFPGIVGTQSFEVSDGTVRVPEGPGLGITVDLEAVRALTL